MSISSSIIATFALIPAMAGSPPQVAEAAENGLHLLLCGGGVIAVPMDRPHEPAMQPCCAKGCHAGSKRKRFDPEQ